MKILQREVFISAGSAAKWDGYIDIKPKFNYNWFYWIPYFSWNKGVPFKHACTSFNISWLIYWFGVTIYWRKWKYDGSSSEISSANSNLIG